MKTKFKIAFIIFAIILVLPLASMAITETDNGVMKIYAYDGFTLEYNWMKAFDIQGYIKKEDGTSDSTLISSTFGNHGYHTFLNVNGAHGEMNGELSYTNKEDLGTKLQPMQYTAYNPANEEQIIDGIALKVQAQFINNGKQLQFVYTLKNTTTNAATISLSTSADVEIDGDDRATIERLEDGSGIRLWTKTGRTKKPVQFVFYGKDVPGTTAIDNIWIGAWSSGSYLSNIFNGNPEKDKIENTDSAFTFSWVNRTINAGETQTYTVLMEVGKINIPNTGITLDNNTKLYYKDVKINGTVTDSDLKDRITIHYSVDGTNYVLPTISTTGGTDSFTIDLTSLNLAAVTPHTLKVWATDSTNCESNVEEKTFTITYVKEPEVTLSTNEWAKDVTFRITDTVNEQQWVDTYQYRFNDGNWTDCAKDTDIPITESGNVKVDVRVKGTQTDDYSNIITVNAKIDKENPTTTVPTVSKTSCSITVELKQTDAHSGIDETKTMYAIKKDGTWSDWQASNTFTGLTHNTEYIVKTKAEDKVGNTSESEELTVKTEELLLGNLVLKINNANGNNYTQNTWTNQNIYVTVEERTAGATTKYKSKENSAQTIEETNQETTVTTQGTTTLTMFVTDGTNTVTSDLETILKIDKVAPVINELSLDNEEWSKENKNITGKATDSLSGITAYQFSNEDNLTISSTGWVDITATNSEITQTKEVTQNEKIYFYVKDAAGNISSSNIDTKIDTQGPDINFSKIDGETTINVTDRGSGIATTQYAWTKENTEPTEWNNYTQAVKYTESSSEKIYLWAKVTDNAGNTTTEKTEFSELKNPTIVCEDEFINKNITFKITSQTEDADVLYQFKINDGEWQSITKDSTYTIKDITDGTVTISTRIIDNAGRISDVTTKTVKVSKVEENNNGNGSQDPSNNNNGKEPANGQKNEQPADKSTAGIKLPYTGATAFIVRIVIIASLIGLCFLLYKKITAYKDI